MPKVSKRGQNILSSPIRKFLPLMLKAEIEGVKVFKLNVGDPDIAIPPQLLPAIKKYKNKSLGYAPSPGISEHVAAWLKYYGDFGVKLKPENLIPTVGGAEAILLAILATTDPGDEIIVFDPLYASYKGFAAMASVKLVPITLKIENNFALPPAKDIIKKISRKTKAIVLINPDNPTGAVRTRAEINRLVKIARGHNLFIITDKTYREIVFFGQPGSVLQVPAAKNCTILVDSVSKRFSCPGARIGVIVSYNQVLLSAVLKFAMVRLSAPTLEQIGLIPILKNARAYTKKITREYKKRRDLVFTALTKIPGVKCQKPNGAFYIIAGLPVKNSEDFVKFLLTKFRYQNQTLMLTPAQDFYVTPGLGKNEVRLAYVLNTQSLKQAMLILKKALEAYKNR